MIDKEGFRYIKKSIKRKVLGWKKYKGTANEICEQILEDCWNNKYGYYQTSAGHFNQFFVRDFAFNIEHLISLGHKERVDKTLMYANKIFVKQGKITTQITPGNKANDGLGFAIDSLPLYLFCLRVSNNLGLLNKKLISKEIKRYEEAVSDDGFIRTDKYFCSMRDHYRPRSSCYANTMLLFLIEQLNELKMPHNFKLTKKQFLNEFWNGKYFYHDRRKQDRIEASANIYPFWTGIIKDNKMKNLAINAIKKEKLDKPFAVKYEAKRHKEDEIWLSYFVPNYEGNTIWIHLASCYIDIVEKKDKISYLKQYKKNIEKYKNFLEVFYPDGKPFNTSLYITDEGMIWCSNYLDYAKKLKV